MAFRLENLPVDYVQALQVTLEDWSKKESDVYLVSKEGHRIFTSRMFLAFYSDFLRTVLDQSSDLTSKTAFSLPASSNSISTLLSLLTTGRLSATNQYNLNEVKETANLLGIKLDNCAYEKNVSLNRHKSDQSFKDTVLNAVVNVESIESKEMTSGLAVKSLADINRQNMANEQVDTDNCEDLGKIVFDVADTVDNETSSIECRFCKRTFINEYKLKSHSIQHTSRFSCDQCDKRFQSTSTLRNHRNIHLAEKPYKCEMCDKAFTQNGNLKTHKLRHHGELFFAGKQLVELDL